MLKESAKKRLRVQRRIQTYARVPAQRFPAPCGWRTIKTAVSAMLVNYFLLRPRVVSLWEGFKDSFKEDSKV